MAEVHPFLTAEDHPFLTAEDYHQRPPTEKSAMPDDLTAAASYFLAAIAENADRELADGVYRAISDLLPYTLPPWTTLWRSRESACNRCTRHSRHTPRRTRPNDLSGRSPGDYDQRGHSRPGRRHRDDRPAEQCGPPVAEGKKPIMPTHPLTEAQRRRKTGEWHRIRGITRPPEYPIGATTYVKARADGGLTIGKGQIRIVLDADEAEQLINVAQELTKPASPRATTPAKARLQRFPMTPPSEAES